MRFDEKMCALEEYFNREVQPTTQPHSDIRTFTCLNKFQKKKALKVREPGSEMLHGQSARWMVSVILLGSSIELENSAVLPICRIWMHLSHSHHQHEGLKSAMGLFSVTHRRCGTAGSHYCCQEGGAVHEQAQTSGLSRNLRGADLGRGEILRFNGTQSTKMAIKGPLWKYSRQLRSPSAVTRVI
jgi:hypothetical protein